MNTKKCTKCNNVKDYSEFYIDKNGKPLSYCKPCRKEKNEKYRNENKKYFRDYYREYNKEYRKKYPERIRKIQKKYDEANPGIRIKSNKNYRKNHPERYRAHVAIGTATASGKLKREPCAVCGESKVHAHHEDYTKPLDVVWLCLQCHSARHRELRLS